MTDEKETRQEMLRKIEDEQYEAEKIQKQVLTEEEQNWEEINHLIHLTEEGKQEWLHDPYFSQLLDEQEHYLRNIQGQRQSFMEDWTDEMGRYRNQLIEQEETLRTEIRKSEQTSTGEKKNGVISKTE